MLRHPIANPQLTVDSPDFNVVSHQQVVIQLDPFTIPTSPAKPSSASVNSGPQILGETSLLRSPTRQMGPRSVSQSVGAVPGEEAWSVDTASEASTHNSTHFDDSVNSSMVIMGRRGFAEIVNGLYEPHFITHDGHPTFRRQAQSLDGSGARDLFLFYHGKNDAWAIGEEIGSRNIVGYAPNRPGHRAHLPSQILSNWFVANESGQFVEDRRLTCGIVFFFIYLLVVVAAERISEFRKQLQQQIDVVLSHVTLDATRLASLCDELRSAQCAIRQLK